MNFNFFGILAVILAFLPGYAIAAYYDSPKITISSSLSTTGKYTINWTTPSGEPSLLYETRIDSFGNRKLMPTVFMGSAKQKEFLKPVENVRYEYRVASVGVGIGSLPATVDVYQPKYAPKKIIPITKKEYGCGPTYAPDYPRSSCGYRTLKYGNAYVFTGRDGVLNDPVIVSQWFEAFGTTPSASAFAYRLDSGANNMFSTLLTDVAHDRDVVIYMYEDPTQSISFSGDGLTLLIQEVNKLKGAKGRPNVLVGLSAGGVVARYALAKMEKQYIEHDTDLYISYDAPHTGANITTDLLNELNRLNGHVDDLKRLQGLSIIGIFLGRPGGSELYSTIKFIESPAARELLTWYTGSSLKKAEYGFPQKSHNVAFSNGAKIGTYRNIAANSLALSWRLDVGSYERSYRVYLNKSGSLDNEAGSSGYAKDYLKVAIDGLRAAEGDEIESVTSPSNVPNHTFITTKSAFAITSGPSPFAETYASTTNGVHMMVPEFHTQKMLDLIAQYQ